MTDEKRAIIKDICHASRELHKRMRPELTDMRTAIRVFDTGATRSPLGDKLQYEGYLNPMVLQRFAEYMHKHQTQSDGTRRAADNWQANIPLPSLMDSATRHFWDWWLHHRNYPDRAAEPVEEALCALMFNAMAYLKQVLEAKDAPQS